MEKARGIFIQDQWLKDFFVKYVHFFPPVATHLESNIDMWIYGHGKFKSFTYKEMYQWFKAHKDYMADQQLGTASEKKKALDAYNATKYWCNMDEREIESVTMKKFRKYILDNEKVVSFFYVISIGFLSIGSQYLILINAVPFNSFCKFTCTHQLVPHWKLKEEIILYFISIPIPELFCQWLETGWLTKGKIHCICTQYLSECCRMQE